MKGIKKILSVLLVAVMLIGHFSFVGAEESPIDLKLAAASTVLMESSTGKILYASNENEKRAPASVTKVMTLLLVMEAIDSGRISLNDEVVCSATASSIGGAQIWLEVGEKFTVNELLKATAIASANDAATQLAEYVGGSVDAFVSMMNQKAKELKMENTTFINPTGLDAEGHVTTAKDIAIMSRELIKHKLIFNYSTVWMDSLRGGTSQLTNTNKMLKTYTGITGLKTGTTDKAGYCVSSTASRDGLDLIAVVMGSPTGEQRFDCSKKLLDYGYSNYTIFKPEKQADFPENVKVNNGVTGKIKLNYEGLTPIVVKKMAKNDYTYSADIPQSIDAPINKGDDIGSVSVKRNGEEIGKFTVKSDDTVEIMTFLDALKKLFYLMIGISA